jgi:crotonobetaine/carnitine-CoA ligase
VSEAMAQTLTQRLRLATPLSDRTLSRTLDKRIAESPTKVAVRLGGNALTYGGLRELAFRVANALKGLGVSAGDVVATMLDNSIDYVTAWAGIGVSGPVQVPINTGYRGDILAYVLHDSGAKSLFIEAKYLDRLVDVVDRVPTLERVVIRSGGAGTWAIDRRVEVVPFEQLLSAPPDRPAIQVRPWDLMSIMYTSGTTGPSKGVLCPQAHAWTGCMAPPVENDDVHLVALPMFHISGSWGGLYNTLIAGATMHLVEAFSASSFWETVRDAECSVTTLMGAMADFLLRQPPGPDDRNHSLKRVVMSPVINDVDAFSQRFGVAVDAGYGTTETGAVLADVSGCARPGLGWPREHVEARLVDKYDAEVQPGQPGELVLRPRDPWTFMDGYLGMPEATRLAWRNLWYHTGDLCRQEETGRYVFVDRLKESIRCRGENVSSYEVENSIMVRPEVAEVAVVAVPSEHTEDDVRAVIVLRPGAALDAETLYRDLADRLPYFMVPRYIDIVDELPKTPTFKIRKDVVRSAGVAPLTWDCVAAGLRATRHGLVQQPCSPPDNQDSSHPRAIGADSL